MVWGNYMVTKILFKSSIAALACISLSACLGSSAAVGPGGGGGGGGTAAYDAKLDQVRGMIPTIVRQTGTANYVGQTRLDTLDPAGTSSTPTGYLVGDIALAANFDTESVSGTATNFAGEVGGQAVTLSGTLDTANSNSPNLVSSSTTTAPIIGTITTTALVANMRGTLTESINNQSSDVELGLQGAFVGPNANAIHGPAVALVGSSGTVGFGFGGAGTYYLERQ